MIQSIQAWDINSTKQIQSRQKYVFLRLIYIDFIDRIYILQLCIISKRVEGNAGQILDEAPKNKPYFSHEGRIFSAFRLAINSGNIHVM